MIIINHNNTNPRHAGIAFVRRKTYTGLMIRKIINKIGSKTKQALFRWRNRISFQKNPALKEVYAVLKNSPEGKWIIGQNDALELYYLIKQFNPKNILELGSGIGASTAIMALAQSTDGKVVSMEQFEKCVNIARRLIPQNLLPKINLIHSPAEAWKDERFSRYVYFSIYKNLPVHLGPFDFVLVDGPDYWLENGQLVNLPNGDLLKLMPHLKPGCKIYVDGRKQAVALYKRFLGNYITPLRENSAYALFERNNKPLDDFKNFEIKDTTLEWVKKTSYFEGQ